MSSRYFKFTKWSCPAGIWTQLRREASAGNTDLGVVSHSWGKPSVGRTTTSREVKSAFQQVFNPKNYPLTVSLVISTLFSTIWGKWR